MSKAKRPRTRLVRKTDFADETAEVDIDALAAVVVLRHPSLSNRAARCIVLEVAELLGFKQGPTAVPEEAPNTISHAPMRFVELLGAHGKRLHIGCIMAHGRDWVEVSHPEKTELSAKLHLRFLPSRRLHKVELRWRREDRAAFTYAAEQPPEAIELFEAEANGLHAADEKMRK